MIRNRTQNLPRTQKHTTRFSATMIANKDKNFDYSFRLKRDIEEGGGMDQHGFFPVSAENYNGEVWNGPRSMQNRSKGRKQVVLQDTILCKRDMETALYFQRMENEKYNAQCDLVMSASRNAKLKLRELDPGAVIVNKSTGLEKAVAQRHGPTEEA